MLGIMRVGSTHWMGGHRRHYIHISCTSHKHSCSTDNTAEACQDRRIEIKHVALKKLIPNTGSPQRYYNLHFDTSLNQLIYTEFVLSYTTDQQTS